MNPRLRSASALVLAACLAARGARAETNPGVTAAPILQMPLGARAVGMGGAFTGVADDASALYHNPAGLSNLTHREVTFMYLKSFSDQNVEFIAAATPLQLPGFIGDGYTALGTSVLFSQNGTIEVNRTNAGGQLIGTQSLSAGSDFVASFGYSERIAHFEIPTKNEDVTFHHYMGIGTKWIRSTLAEQYSASTFAADFGYFVRVPEWRTTAGFALQNLGGDLTFIESGDPLPLTLAGGFAFDPALPDSILTRRDTALLIAVDGEYLSRERQWQADVGVEYSLLRRHAVRLGYRLNRDAIGLTFGFGTAWNGIEIDYAWGLTSALSDTHRFSFTYRFGRVAAQKREMKQRPFIERMPDREELRGIEEQTPVPVDPPKRRPRREPRGQGAAPGWIY